MANLAVTLSASLLILLTSLTTTSVAFTGPRAFAKFQRQDHVALSRTELAMAGGGGGGKRRRRRRKDGASSGAPSPPTSAGTNDESEAMSYAKEESIQIDGPVIDDGDLPDFDLDEDEPVAPDSTQAKKTAKAAKVASPSSGDAEGVELNSDNMNLQDPRVLEAMRGSRTSTGPKTMDQLLRDRSLEKSLKFDNAANEALPSFSEIASKSRSGSDLSGGDSFGADSKVGRKRARAEARRAAAIEAEEASKEDGGVFSNIPALVGEDGKVSPLKILEAGTWAGIFILVAWEIYLNSPFFDRAAPMAPVVYQLWL